MPCSCQLGDREGSKLEACRRRHQPLSRPLTATEIFLHGDLESGLEMVRSRSLDRRKVEFSDLWSRRRAERAGVSHEGNRGLVASAQRPLITRTNFAISKSRHRTAH
jgi:hypothetical protein